MKLGYSLLLGEFVQASEARHADTTGFQIVCPSCKDPVIKVERPHGDELSEFFSHRASRPGDADCEMRVASIPTEQRVAADAISRGQTLKVFVSVLRDTLMLARTDVTHWEDNAARAGVSFFAQVVAGRLQAKELLGPEDVEATVDLAAIAIDSDDTEQRTGLGLSYRRRLAKDLIAHLRAPHADKSRGFAAKFAILQAIAALKFLPSEGPHTDLANVAADNLLSGDGRMEWLRRAAAKGSAENRQIMVFERLVAIALVQALLSFPVMRMLGNHRAGRPPLDGVTSLDALGISEDILPRAQDQNDNTGGMAP